METTVEHVDGRAAAVDRLKKKSDFRAHFLAYVTVNALLLSIWAATGRGFFWPVFPLFGWGIGVVFNWWDAYRRPALPGGRDPERDGAVRAKWELESSHT